MREKAASAPGGGTTGSGGVTPAVPTGLTGPTGPTGAGPIIAVCLRFTDLRPTVDPLTGSVSREVYTAGVAPADAAALERALRIAAEWSATVLAVTAGPPAADEMLREVAALGVLVRRVPWPPGPAGGGAGGAHGEVTPGGPEPLGDIQEYLRDLADGGTALAAALAAAILDVGEPDLVLCGDRSSDRGTGALPAQLAHHLGSAQALGLVDLRVSDAAQAGRPIGWYLIGERRLDAGRRERLRIPRPAVCSVEAAGLRLRRAGLRASLAAGRTVVATIPATATATATATAQAAAAPVTVRAAKAYRPRPRVVPPPAGDTPRDRLSHLTGALVAHEPPAIVGPVEAGEAADALLAFLDRHGYLTEPEPVSPTADLAGR